MKKLFALIFAALLVFGLSTASMAVPVTIGGNFRAWLQNSSDGAGNSDTTFAFDRLALDANADLGKNTGLKNELQIRSIRTSVNDANNDANNYGDLRLESFYYQKDTFIKGDELDIGAFGLNNFLPFKNGYGNAIIAGGLGDGLKMGNYVGVIYTFMQPMYDISVGLANNRPNEDWNKSGEGLNASLRVNYKPLKVKGLKIGAGYERVASKSTPVSTYVYDGSSNNETRLVVDASYNPGTPLSGMIEYATVNPTTNGVAGANLGAIYGEVGYKIGVWQLYGGRAVNTSGNLIGNNMSATANTGSLATLNSNYNVAGALYTLPSGLILDLEYVTVGGGTSGRNSIGLRCKANF